MLMLRANQFLERIEFCYLLKVVDRHDDTRVDVNPWSIRQTAVYQKFNITTRQSCHITVRLASEMETRLRRILEGDRDQAADFNSHWKNFHLLCLGSLSESWRQYINFLDMRITQLV